jgi:hypothetical protein
MENYVENYNPKRPFWASHSDTGAVSRDRPQLTELLNLQDERLTKENMTAPNSAKTLLRRHIAHPQLFQQLLTSLPAFKPFPININAGIQLETSRTGKGSVHIILWPGLDGDLRLIRSISVHDVKIFIQIVATLIGYVRDLGSVRKPTRAAV